MDVCDLIKMHEGYSRAPYYCTANRLTIGYGRNLSDKGISEPEATYLMDNDIKECVQNLREEPYWLDLNEARQAILIDMVYNLGWGGFREFRGLRKALQSKDYNDAAVHMEQSQWYKQVGKRSKRLVTMMKTGEWPDALPFIQKEVST